MNVAFFPLNVQKIVALSQISSAVPVLLQLFIDVPRFLLLCPYKNC